jgi:hypothetical protein
MNEIINHLIIGMGSVVLAPFNALPRPGYRITLPPETATQAIAHDFSMISGDLARSVDKVKHARQLELKLKP